MATAGIPTIDISHFIGATSDLNGDVVKQWDRAFREYGFHQNVTTNDRLLD